MRGAVVSGSGMAALGLAAACMAGILGGCGEDTPTGGGNLAPRIVSVNVSPSSVILGGEARVTALVSDPDGDVLSIRWRATGGHFVDSTRTSTTWKAPDVPGSYFLVFSASDGRETSSDSVDVVAGNVALTVFSDPPGALITLDGSSTGLTTPRTFDPLPAGFHSVSLFSTYYRFETLPGREMVHGDRDTLRFELPPSVAMSLDSGRDDLLEIGGVAYLPKTPGAPGSLGLVYAARTATETALFSTSLLLGGSIPRGVRLVGNVRLEEPIAIGAGDPDGGPDLYFVTEGESLAVVPIRDKNRDGTVDSVGTVLRLRKSYAPSVSRLPGNTMDRVAFSLGRSEDPPALQVFWSTYSAGVLSGPQLATPNAGRLPAWKPGEDILAYVRNDDIFRSIMNPGNLPQADTLFSEGVNTAPAWGIWGAKTLAFLHGEDGGPFTQLMITAMGAPDAVTIHTGLSDPRYLAWSDDLETAVAVTHHPGGTPQILIVRSIPVP